jgi:hypothetical protein
MHNNVDFMASDIFDLMIPIYSFLLKPEYFSMFVRRVFKSVQQESFSTNFRSATLIVRHSTCICCSPSGTTVPIPHLGVLCSPDISRNH